MVLWNPAIVEITGITGIGIYNVLILNQMFVQAPVWDASPQFQNPCKAQIKKYVWFS